MKNRKGGHATAQGKKQLCDDIDRNITAATCAILDGWFAMANAGQGGPVVDVDEADDKRKADYYAIMDKLDSRIALGREIHGMLAAFHANHG